MQQRKQDNNCLNVFYKFLYEIAKTIAEQTDYVHVSGITFIRYAYNQKIGKPNKLKFWEQ
jgi:hypothetical protein